MLPRGDVRTHATSSSSWLSVALIPLAAATLSACTDQTPTEPRTEDPTTLFGAFPGANGLIAWASNRVPGGGILTMQLGVFTPQTLRSTGGAPAWSPNGAKIAFTDHDGNDYEIFVMNADGTGVVQLTDNTAYDDAPSWSADGTKIAFYSDLAGVNQIFTIDSNTGGVPTQLTTSGGNSGPAWSPDGSKIAFTSSRDGDLDIYVMDANGGNQTPLTNNADRDFHPNWSPDGSKIAFTHGGEVDSDIHVMNADGTNPTNLTQTPTHADVWPAWSPDGNKIAFVTDRDGNAEIYLMWADGSGVPTNFSFHSAADVQPDWQPIPSTPPDITEDVQALIAAVSQLDAHKSVKNSLTASLNQVLAALDANDTAGACVALEDFLRKVNSQSGKKLSASDAAELVAQASAISDALGCAG